jgi:hypothetical protein
MIVLIKKKKEMERPNIVNQGMDGNPSKEDLEINM